MLIVLDVCLPEIVPVTSFTGLCTGRDSLPNPRAEAPTTAFNCAMPGSPRRDIARRPVTSLPRRSCAIAGRFWSGNWICLRNVQVVVVLGKIAFDTYLSVLKDRGAIGRVARFPVRP